MIIKRETFHKLLDRLRIRRRRILFFHCDLLREPTPVESDPDHAAWSIVTLEEAQTMRDYEDSWNTRAAVIQRIKTGHQLFAIKVEGSYANFAWVERSRFLIPAFDQWAALPDYAVHIAGVYTKPAYRNRGLTKLNYGRILRHLKSNHVHHVFLNIDTDNEPSLRAARRVGFKDYLKIVYVRIVLPRFFRFNDGRRSRFFIKISKDVDRKFNRRLFTDHLADA